MKKKKILMVCEAFGGGVFTYVSQLCNDMVDDFEVYLAYSLRPQTPKNYKSFLDERVHLIEVKNFGNLLNIGSDIKVIKELRRIEKDIQPDIIHLHSSIAGGIGRIAFKGKNNTVLYTPHGYAHILMGRNRKTFVYEIMEKILGKEDDAMSVFFMDFDMAPSVIWARDLYDQMQIRSDFRKWFPRMCQYGFVEGRDYEFVPRVRPQDEGGRTVQRYVKDYRITLEMAKQLYKLHHFHKNDCFRSCEGQHCMGTDHWMQAVIELLHQHKCKSHAPPKRFYESQPPDSLVTTTQIAKEYGCGAKVFNRLLHLHGIQYRANNQWVLYAKHQDKGYTANLVFRLHRSDGSAVEKLHTAWTHKGRKFLYHELKRRGILPMAEQEG